MEYDKNGNAQGSRALKESEVNYVHGGSINMLKNMRLRPPEDIGGPWGYLELLGAPIQSTNATGPRRAHH